MAVALLGLAVHGLRLAIAGLAVALLGLAVAGLVALLGLAVARVGRVGRASGLLRLCIGVVRIAHFRLSVEFHDHGDGSRAPRGQAYVVLEGS